MTDVQRAAIISLISSIFPVLVLLGIADLSQEAIGAIMLVVSNALTAFMLFWKKGQQRGPA